MGKEFFMVGIFCFMFTTLEQSNMIISENGMLKDYMEKSQQFKFKECFL